MRALLAVACLFAAACAAPQDDAEGDGAAGAGALEIGATPEAQEVAIVATAKRAAAGKRPGGHCYAAVARYIDTVGYGKMPVQPKGAIGNLPEVPRNFIGFAHQFADYVNAGTHADDLGLIRLPLDNPYDAPAGAIVVVRAGTPGTSHPTAGDITIAAGDGHFYNDGEMSYGGSERFPPRNNFVLGIYVPAPEAL